MNLMGILFLYEWASAVTLPHCSSYLTVSSVLWCLNEDDLLIKYKDK